MGFTCMVHSGCNEAIWCTILPSLGLVGIGLPADAGGGRIDILLGDASACCIRDGRTVVAGDLGFVDAMLRPAEGELCGV